MMGTVARPPTWRASSKRSPPGSFKSSSTRSTACASSAANMALPVCTQVTRIPLLPRYSATSSQMAASSSSIRICGATELVMFSNQSSVGARVGARSGMDDIVSEAKPLRRRSTLLALIISAVMILVASLSLLHLRREAIDTQGRELRLLSLALTAEVGRGLQGVDEGFRAMQTELREGRLPIGGPLAARVLKTHVDLMPMVQNLWLFDEQGQVLAAADASTPPALASFAPSLDSLQGDRVAISRPYAAAPGAPSRVAMAAHFPADAGRPGGWIVAALPAESLLGAFSIASPAPDARMAVFRTDGVRLLAPSWQAPRSAKNNWRAAWPPC